MISNTVKFGHPSPPLRLIRFGHAQTFPDVPVLEKHYTLPESRRKTVAILGSSQITQDITYFVGICKKMVQALIHNGFNILTCGRNQGIFGVAYESARIHSRKDPITGQPLQNLAIYFEPARGGEDPLQCVPIGKALSEQERSKQFYETSDTLVFFPGRTATLLEAVSSIQLNDYNDESPLKKVILVGRDFFKGLDLQYRQLAKSGLLRHKLEELYQVLDNADELIARLNPTLSQPTQASQQEKIAL